ncbi:efflux transporter outer membrane subunit [Parvularcula oceani]|uniref:efflux transporter outer membrane subunit n=1 Tax=Parvularcula oceani TaxID=1247963 RepID=UPI0009DE374B|nr:efflux transporter outer membrane subunit [Parvularcula oceani]
MKRDRGVPKRSCGGRLLAGVACLTLVTACATVPYEDYEADDAIAGYAYRGASGGDVAVETLGWREFFRDETLQRLIEAALENNRDLRVATARILETRGRYRIERSARLPNVEASAGGNRSRIPLGSYDVAEELGEGLLGGEEALTFTRYDVNVAIPSYELDFWGRVRNLSAAARAEYLATVAAQRAFRLSVIGDTARAYFAFAEANEAIALAEATLESRKTGYEIAQRRYRAGAVSELTLRQNEALVLQAEGSLSAQRLERARAVNSLAAIVGAPISPDELVSGSLDGAEVVRALDAGIPSELLLARPDLAAAELRLEGAQASVRAARAAFFPSISLTGSAGYASSELDDLFEDSTFAWNFGPSISLPIFDGGRRRANLDVARARTIAEVAEYEGAVQSAFRDVADALAGRRLLAEQIAVAERTVAALARIADLARLRYDEGQSRYLEVLDAERNLFAAQRDLIGLRRAELENLVGLYLALGGGDAGASEPQSIEDLLQRLAMES